MNPNSMYSEYIPIKDEKCRNIIRKKTYEMVFKCLQIYCFLALKFNNNQGVVVHAFNPSIWELEAGRSLNLISACST